MRLFIPISLLLVGITARLVAITLDTYGGFYDDYLLMMGVEKGLPEYVAYFGGNAPLSQLVHYWVSYRFFGNSVTGYLVLPFIASVLTLVTVFLGVRRFWKSAALCTFALTVLVYNAHALHLTQYALFSYTNSLFISALLLFLVLYLSRGTLSRKQWWIISLASLPITFFTDITLVIPLAAGVLTVLFTRAITISGNKRIRVIKKSVRELSPLLLFPLFYFLIFHFHPLTNLGPEKRPDMAPLFFYSSGQPNNIWGMAVFALRNSHQLFTALITPKNVSIGFPYTILLSLMIKIMLIVTLGMGVYCLIKRNWDRAIASTAAYLFLAFFLALLGGMLGVYPFGNERYMSYLLIPLAIIIGYSMNQAVMLVRPVIKVGYFPAVFISIVILIVGGVINLHTYQEYQRLNRENESAFEKIREMNADQVFYTEFMVPALSIRMKETYNTGRSMGWGSFWTKDTDASLSGVINGNSVLMIAYSKASLDHYASWTEFVGTNYTEEREITGPSIWAGYYKKKE